MKPFLERCLALSDKDLLRFGRLLRWLMVILSVSSFGGAIILPVFVKSSLLPSLESTAELDKELLQRLGQGGEGDELPKSIQFRYEQNRNIIELFQTACVVGFVLAGLLALYGAVVTHRARELVVLAAPLELNEGVSTGESS